MFMLLVLLSLSWILLQRSIRREPAAIPSHTRRPSGGTARTGSRWPTNWQDCNGNRRLSTRAACRPACSVGGARSPHCPRTKTSRIARRDVTRCHPTRHTTPGAGTPGSAWVPYHVALGRAACATFKFPRGRNSTGPVDDGNRNAHFVGESQVTCAAISTASLTSNCLWSKKKTFDTAQTLKCYPEPMLLNIHFCRRSYYPITLHDRVSGDRYHMVQYTDRMALWVRGKVFKP